MFINRRRRATMELINLEFMTSQFCYVVIHTDYLAWIVEHRHLELLICYRKSAHNKMRVDWSIKVECRIGALKVVKRGKKIDRMQLQNVRNYTKQVSFTPSYYTKTIKRNNRAIFGCRF